MTVEQNKKNLAMKNQSLVTLAILASAGAASAQSSIRLFGIVDATVSHYTSETEIRGGSTSSVKTRQTALSNSGNAGSRLGFRGTEDLGGGLAAGFWLEAGLNNDSGAGAGAGGSFQFNRRSTVSLSSRLGEIRLGRDYTPTFWNDNIFDPFGTNGVGTNLIAAANGFSSNGAATGGFSANPNYVRASNSIGYFLPAGLGGFYGQAMYAFHEKDKFEPGTGTPKTLNNARTGRYVGGRVGYANGPLDMAVAYGTSTVADDYYRGLTVMLNTVNAGASYDFGPVKLYGEYSRVELDLDNDGAWPIDTNRSAKGWLLGATVPVGVGLIRVAYSAVSLGTNRFPSQNGDPKADKWAIGYVHNLSKRTALYATAARIHNRNGYDLIVGGPGFVSAPAQSAAVYTPNSSSGYDIGIRHAF